MCFQILQDQLTSEKDENKQLKEEIEKLKSSGAAASISVVSPSRDRPSSSGADGDLLEENQYLKEEIEELRASLDAGGGGGGVDVTVVAAATAASEEEKKRLKDERNKMQEEKIQAQKVGNILSNCWTILFLFLIFVIYLKYTRL